MFPPQDDFDFMNELLDAEVAESTRLRLLLEDTLRHLQRISGPHYNVHLDVIGLRRSLESERQKLERLRREIDMLSDLLNASAAARGAAVD
ncbi:MAG TPA: hypothetical protein VG966_12240 [Hyphomicrobiaceae bacterium]|nr:hypothetical protein [Hyphomicrobiaceae bacterium]